MIVKWSSEAREDLLDGWVYIAADKPRAADRAEEAVLDTAVMLETFPHVGRTGRIEGTRELVVSATPFIVILKGKTRS